MLLRQAGVDTFVSHSSLGLDERRSAERAFSQRQNCVIVATSSLELGLDVGDLDRVIQIDAPPSVSSFLQRMGRTGRRPDTTSNCLFLATTDEGLLRASALIDLWHEGFVEPVVAPPKPFHILAQQLMALVLQERGVGRSEWFRDHWGAVQTIFFAGGGTKGGTVVGAGDKIGGCPSIDPQTPENMAATIYQALGLPKTAAWTDAINRPHHVYHGEPIRGLS